MDVEIKQLDGMTLIGKSGSNHLVTLDASEAVGGSNAAMQPMEMLLIALGGCTGMDVISILQKKRVPFNKVNMKLHADRADEHPKVFTRIAISFQIYGNKEKIKTIDVERAIELSSTKYCSASQMLNKTAQITYDYQIFDAE